MFSALYTQKENKLYLLLWLEKNLYIKTKFPLFIMALAVRKLMKRINPHLASLKLKSMFSA